MRISTAFCWYTFTRKPSVGHVPLRTYANASAFYEGKDRIGGLWLAAA